MLLLPVAVCTQRGTARSRCLNARRPPSAHAFPFDVRRHEHTLHPRVIHYTTLPRYFARHIILYIIAINFAPDRMQAGGKNGERLMLPLFRMRQRSIAPACPRRRP